MRPTLVKAIGFSAINFCQWIRGGLSPDSRVIEPGAVIIHPYAGFLTFFWASIPIKTEISQGSTCSWKLVQRTACHCLPVYPPSEGQAGAYGGLYEHKIVIFLLSEAFTHRQLISKVSIMKDVHLKEKYLIISL